MSILHFISQKLINFKKIKQLPTYVLIHIFAATTELLNLISAELKYMILKPDIQLRLRSQYVLAVV